MTINKEAFMQGMMELEKLFNGEKVVTRIIGEMSSKEHNVYVAIDLGENNDMSYELSIDGEIKSCGKLVDADFNDILNMLNSL